MDELNIILFLCNWGPHVAFQTLQDRCADLPLEIKMIRIPCTGRISKALLFKAFEMGADGVALVGCAPGSCRYGSGTSSAEQNVEDTRSILDLLGIGKERLCWATFLPEEAEPLLSFLTGFSQTVRALGKTRVSHLAGRVGAQQVGQSLSDLLSAHDVYACQDCGKCSSSCPLALSGKLFSPRTIAGSVLSLSVDSGSAAQSVWSCLTCGLCYERCPSAVDFSSFVRDLRWLRRQTGESGAEAHGGFFHSLMRTMTSPELKMARWGWLPDGIRVDPEGKIGFFGGCAPYFDVFFRRHLDIRTRDILLDSLRLLNFFDIHPRLLEDERCCGHDLLWSGDRENFLKLAERNAEIIQRAGLDELITTCPECYRTLSREYPGHGFRLDVRVTHLYEFLEREIDKGAVDFQELNRKLTFQDPCRLSRMENRGELPRKLIERLNSRGFEEMVDHGNSALCCGNVAWIGCDSYSKALQVKRLAQAHATGSDLLVTGCPKCQIHLRCAMEDPHLGAGLYMEMSDLASIIARTIRWKSD